MDRRHFLKISGVLSAQGLLASTVLPTLWSLVVNGQEISLQSLHSALDPKDGTLLVPSDSQFAQYQMAFNQRTLKTPLVRVLCKTPQAVSVAVQWARANSVPLAIRSGGHSFEGLSQTTGLAIDTRPMEQVTLASDNNSFLAGAGCQLGHVYETLASQNRAVPAGSCPPVGITGHTMGGGYGLVARPLGLACDSLLGAEIVNADGKILNCSASENADLFWALRGGGAGSFGVVTHLHFRTHPVENVIVYSLGWSVHAEVAAEIMKTWQAWAPNAPREITSLLKVSRGSDGLFNLRAIGQTIGTEHQLQQELDQLTSISKSTVNAESLPFIGAVHHFGGSFDPEYIYMKGKSDYIKEVMSSEALSHFLEKIPSGIDVIFDSYGGAIRDLKDNDTAFAHRSGVLSSLQYYTQWSHESEGTEKLLIMRTFHESMRPYMSGAAYFNYCDLDIKDYAEAYWGANLPQLVKTKIKYDPKNFFRHAQSVPLRVTKS